MRAVDAAFADGLFELSPSLPHGIAPVQRVLPLFEEALPACPVETRVRFAWVPRVLVLPLAQAALSMAASSLFRLRGGTDLSRGFEGRGAEFPRLFALLRGRDYYSDTSTTKALREMEELRLGYRKQRLEPIPIQCPRKRKLYRRRFGRNDVYIARAALQLAAGLEWLQPLIRELRKRIPKWLWRRAREARRYPVLKPSKFVALVTLPFEKRRAVLEGLAEAKRWRAKLRKWRQRDREKRGKRQRSKRTGVQVPITPALSFSSTKKKGSRAPLAPSEKVGAAAPGSPGELPSGQPPSSPAAAVRTAPPNGWWRPPQGAPEALPVSTPVLESATGEGDDPTPWRKYLPTGPP